MTIRPQRKNANRHTERGMHALERSIEQDGWIGAITVAADGETFDGSARVETTAANGMLNDAIVVETDGRKPIIVKRTDIPTATDPRAVRLGLAANRVAQLNLEWEPDVLAEIAQEIDVGALWTPMEWREAAMSEDDEDAGPVDPNELWKGMPEYEYTPRAFKSIAVHFATEEDFHDFARLINQTLTDRTHSIWHPYREKDDLRNLRYQADE